MSFAFENWQVIGGDKSSYLLPIRQENKNGSWKEYAKDQSIINRNSSSDDCPATTAVIYKIFEQLVVKNNLQNYIDVGPGMGLKVECSEFQAGISSKGPRASSTFVVLPSSIMAAFDYEDEIAATMAHEISHILLEHYFQVNQLIKKLKINMTRVEWGLDSRPPELKALTFKTESEADKLGILLMINAGYNPKYIKTMLEKLSNQSAGKILTYIGQTFFDDGHGTNSARVQRVNSYLQYAHVPDTPGIVSPEFQSAKEEILKKTE